jgi:rubrerythrin
LDGDAIALLAERPDVRDAARLWPRLTEQERADWRARAAARRAERERAERDEQLRRYGHRCHRCAVRYIGDTCPQCHTPREDAA